MLLLIAGTATERNMANNKECTKSRTQYDILNGNADGTKYISIDAAINELCCNFDQTDVTSFYPGIKDAVRMWLNNIPDADVVSVVRCMDCVACVKEDEYEYWCAAYSPAHLVCKDDYCSRGERRRCQVAICGYCEDGKCYNSHRVRVKHSVCPGGYGVRNNEF